MDSHGYKFQRITPTALSAIIPDVPTVTMVPLTRGYYGNPVTLTCGVDSLVPFELRWFKDNLPLGNKLHYRCCVNSHIILLCIVDILFYVKCTNFKRQFALFFLFLIGSMRKIPQQFINILFGRPILRFLFSTYVDKITMISGMEA